MQPLPLEYTEILQSNQDEKKIKTIYLVIHMAILKNVLSVTKKYLQIKKNNNNNFKMNLSTQINPNTWNKECEMSTIFRHCTAYDAFCLGGKHLWCRKIYT